MTPYQYFRNLFPDEIITDVVQQTNLYSYRKKEKNIKTTEEEIRSLIGVVMKIGIVSLLSYKCYWSRQLRYSPVAMLCHVTGSNCFWKTFTLSIMMKLIKMTNLLK